MAGKLTYKGAELALDGALGRAATTARDVYLALLTAAPNQSTTMATMSEATFTYTRPLVELGAAAGTPRTMSNLNDELIGPLADATGAITVSHWAVVSAQTGTVGDVLAYGDFTTARTPAANDSLRLAAGDLDIALD